MGSRFVFIANVKPAKNDPMPRYHLSAYCKVAERIGQDEAVRRFGGRSNVEIDALPPGASLDLRGTRLRDAAPKRAQVGGFHGCHRYGTP